MKRLVVMTAMVGLLATACGGQAGDIGPGDGGQTGTPTDPSPNPTGTGSPSPGPTTPPSPTGSPSGRTFTYELWFHYGEGGLFVTRRTEPFTESVGRRALTALLEGPSAREIEAGVGTQIPQGTRLLDLAISDGTATVDLSGEYESGGGSASMFMRLAQVVYTTTQFPTVDDVLFRLDGEPVEVFSGEGILLEDPVGREDYEDLLPPILVEEPIIGQTVDNPVAISGTANVFEANVSIRILDQDGNVIAETFATATCGTGCRGTYETTVTYDVDQDQPGTVEVFESSAQDGQPINVIAIPVTLTA